MGTGASVSGTTFGNREVEASSTGDGGAAIDVRNGNATAESKPDVDVVVGGSSGSETRLTAASITVRTNAIGSARSSSSTDGIDAGYRAGTGGLVAVVANPDDAVT